MNVVFDDDAGNTVRFGEFRRTNRHPGGLVLVELSIISTKAKHVVGLVKWLPEIGSNGFCLDQWGCLQCKRLDSRRSGRVNGNDDSTRIHNGVADLDVRGVA